MDLEENSFEYDLIKKIDDIKRNLIYYMNRCKDLENNNIVLDISLGRELQAHKDTNKELETWKKIAEFMADFINMYTLSGEENQYCHRVIDCQEIGGSRSCIECIIDWARKEVEKNGNK